MSYGCGIFSTTDPRSYGNILGECADICHLYGNVLEYHPLIGCVCVRSVALVEAALDPKWGTKAFWILAVYVCEVRDQLARDLQTGLKHIETDAQSYHLYITRQNNYLINIIRLVFIDVLHFYTRNKYNQHDALWIKCVISRFTIAVGQKSVPWSSP